MCEVYRSVHGILSQQYWDFKVRRTAELLTASKVLSNRSIMNTLFYCCNRIYYSLKIVHFIPYITRLSKQIELYLAGGTFK